MTGAMYAAVSGLQTHMNKLNVIGNNVANVNTAGYKAARMTFLESLYTTSRSGSNGTAYAGGVNPSQIGYGCSVGTIDLDMSTKNYMPTGKAWDCMIDGDGFFMVGDKPLASGEGDAVTLANTNARDLNLTRVGNFNIDPQGYLVDGQGNVVYGYVTTSGEEGGLGDAPGTCTDIENPGVSTQLVPIRLPFAANEKVNGVVPGAAIFPGVKDGVNVYPDSTSAVTDGTLVKLSSMSIDQKTGKIVGVNDADGQVIVVGYIALAKVTNPNGVTHINGPYYKAMEGAGACDATSIGGVLDGRYTNNATDNQKGDTLIQSSGKTALITGGLESSGTDIANEFTEMITTQRGYQANSRIITVTDSMLEELVNIKR